MAGIELERIRDVATLLGGRKVLKVSVSNPDQMRRLVRSGLPYKSFWFVVRLLHLDDEKEVAAITGMAPRTLARRRVSRTLRPDESDRLYRLARVAARAVDVLGSNEKAERWLKKPNPALGHEVPLRILDTDVGARQVEAILGRIEQGVFS